MLSGAKHLGFQVCVDERQELNRILRFAQNDK